MIKYWKNLEIEGYLEIRDFALTLPYLSADLMAKGVDILTQKIDPLAENEPRLLQFLSYTRRQWLPLAKILSVFRRPYLTNNTSELTNRYLQEDLGRGTPLWKMLGKYFCHNPEKFSMRKTGIRRFFCCEL